MADARDRPLESHVAARMRRHGLSDGEVVLNNVTCGNQGLDKDFPRDV
jgi:hypothetical protein